MSVISNRLHGIRRIPILISCFRYFLAMTGGTAQDELDAKAALWAQAVSVSSVKLLVPITLDLQAPNYAQWRGLFEVSLQKFALDDHIRAVAPSTPDAHGFDSMPSSALGCTRLSLPTSSPW